MQSMQIGIKVDKGLTTIPNTDAEKITEGLDGLGERLENYKKKGEIYEMAMCL